MYNCTYIFFFINGRKMSTNDTSGSASNPSLPSGSGSNNSTGKNFTKKKLSPISVAFNSINTSIGHLEIAIAKTSAEQANTAKLVAAKETIKLDIKKLENLL